MRKNNRNTHKHTHEQKKCSIYVETSIGYSTEFGGREFSDSKNTEVSSNSIDLVILLHKFLVKSIHFNFLDLNDQKNPKITFNLCFLRRYIFPVI